MSKNSFDLIKLTELWVTPASFDKPSSTAWADTPANKTNFFFLADDMTPDKGGMISKVCRVTLSGQIQPHKIIH